MDSFQQIYAARADQYHRMIDWEDVDRHLSAALQAICPLAAQIRAMRWAHLPEWTGIWSKQIEG